MKNHSRNNRKKTRKPRACTGKRTVHYDSPLMILRQNKGMTLAQLSDATGIPASGLSGIEAGRSAAIKTFEKLAKYFGVSLDGLVRGDMTMTLASLPKEEVNADSEPMGILDIIQHNRETVGKKGEKLVVALERAALVGTPYAKAVSGAPAHKASTHFDVLSYTTEGVPRHIEVKSTQYGCDKEFILSADELTFMLDCVKNGRIYELHRVCGLKDPATADRVIYTPEDLMSKFTMTPASYRFTVKEEYRHDRT